MDLFYALKGSFTYIQLLWSHWNLLEVSWYPVSKKWSLLDVCYVTKIGFMQYLLEKRKDKKPQQHEGSCRIGLENEDELLLKRIAAVGWQIHMVLPAAWQLPRLNDISSSATSPQSQKLLHQLTKTTCNSGRKFKEQNLALLTVWNISGFFQMHK